MRGRYTGREPRGQRDFQGVPPAHPRKDSGVEGEEHRGAHDTPGLEPEWHQLEPKWPRLRQNGTPQTGQYRGNYCEIPVIDNTHLVNLRIGNSCSDSQRNPSISRNSGALNHQIYTIKFTLSESSLQDLSQGSIGSRNLCPVGLDNNSILKRMGHIQQFAENCDSFADQEQPGNCALFPTLNMLGFTGNKGLASQSLRVNCFFEQHCDPMVWGEKTSSLRRWVKTPPKNDLQVT